MHPFAMKPPKWVYLVFLVGIGTLSVRALLDSSFANSALLYVATPFLISFLLFQFVPKPESTGSLRRYLAHLRDATIIMLATSAFLFEGFICVLFFMPIYYLGVTIGFLFSAFSEKKHPSDKNRLRASFIPLIVAVMALEGTAPSTSFERRNQVTRTVIMDADVATLQSNMALPVELPEERDWFLSIFPLPVDVQAGSLEAGDVHLLRFIYKRWFFTNIKEGEFHLRIDSVSDTEVVTSVVENTSYLAAYLNLRGTRVTFKEMPDGRTEVSLTIEYDRMLDPAWYFGPMQRYAVERSGDYFIDAVFARGITYE